MKSIVLPASTAALGRSWNMIFLAWLVAAAATLGALFLGEVMSLPACVLCWYQRIFMFPLALILPLGLFAADATAARHAIHYATRCALVLAVPGFVIAVFHQLLVAGVIPERIRPCTQGVPCSEKVIEWFGFITIPLLSLAAFSVIIMLAAATLTELKRGTK